MFSFNWDDNFTEQTLHLEANDYSILSNVLDCGNGSNAAKVTTEVVVQGVHRVVSQELIDELKDICKVACS